MMFESSPMTRLTTRKARYTRGVPSSRLRTVSFGEAKPAVVGHDESAWRYNRRVEFRAGS